VTAEKQLHHSSQNLYVIHGPISKPVPGSFKILRPTFSRNYKC